MSDLMLANNTTSNNLEVIDNQNISKNQLNNIKEEQLLDDKTEIKQKELTTQKLFEELKTDLEAKQPSKAPKIIERIIGGVLLGAAAVAAVAVSLASFGVATAVTGAVVGTLGGTLGTSIISGAAGLIGIGTLVHSGLSKPSAEAYAAGRLESLLTSSFKKTNKMPQEMGKFSKDFVIDVIKQVNNEVLKDIDNVDECKRIISATKKFINNKLEVLSKFQDTYNVNLSAINSYAKNSTQEYIEQQIRQENKDNLQDFSKQFLFDIARQEMIIEGKEFDLNDAEAKTSSLKKLFPNKKISYFLSWLFNQSSCGPLSVLLTTKKNVSALEFGIAPKDMPNCISTTVTSVEDKEEQEKGIEIVPRSDIETDNARLIFDIKKIDDNKNKTSKAIVTISKNYAITDYTKMIDKNDRKFGNLFGHIRFEVDITNPDNIVISDAKVSVSASKEPNFDVNSKANIVNKLNFA